MTSRSACTATILILSCITNLALADVTPFFQPLGVLEGYEKSVAAGISHDGTVVVGLCSMDSGAGEIAIRWTPTDGMVSLGTTGSSSMAFGVSNGGSVVVGANMQPDYTYDAFRWTAEAGMEELEAWTAAACSADGSVIAGMSLDLTPFRWTEESGVVALSDLHGVALDVSADGAVVVGRVSVDGLRQKAFRWDETGSWEFLPAPQDVEETRAMGVSADGRVTVGIARTYSGSRRVVLWDGTDLPVFLPDLPSGGRLWEAGAISEDGSVVAGRAIVEGGFSAFVWDEQHGSRELVDILVDECGVDLMGWTPRLIGDISPDGLTLVGVAIAPDGHEEAFMARIPEPAGFGILVFLGTLATTRRRR